ncbi:Hypothetical predicted protein, partial [Pelobates cultripes]
MLEPSEASLEEKHPLTSPRSGATTPTSDSGEDEAPLTKGNYRRLLVDLWRVWKEDLQVTQAEIVAVHKK